MESHWNFIEFCDLGGWLQNPGIVPRRRANGVPRGLPATDPDCCKLQYGKISRYQIASFEGYSKYEIYKLKAYKLRRLGKVVR